MAVLCTLEQRRESRQKQDENLQSRSGDEPGSQSHLAVTGRVQRALRMIILQRSKDLFRTLARQRARVGRVGSDQDWRDVLETLW